MLGNSQTTSKTSLGILFGAGAGALWGLVFLAPQLVPDFSPLHLTVGRYLFYGLLSVLLLASRWSALRSLLTRREWLAAAGLALIGNLLYYFLLASAVQLGGIAMTALVIGFLPVTVTLIGSRDRHAVPLRKLALSLTCCTLGALCIGWQALVPASGSTSQSLLGLLCALGALVSWTWFAVANSRWLVRLTQVRAQDWNLLIGVMTGAMTLLLLPLLVFSDHSGYQWSDWMRLVGVAAGIALLASIVGNALWNQMSRLLPLALVGQMILFETLFALIYGFVWEQRLPTLMESLAFILVSLSVILCVAAHRKPAQAEG